VLARCLSLLQRHWIKVLVPALVLGLLAAYPVGSHYYAEYHLRAAQRAVARYEFDEAAEHLAACLRFRPDDASLHFQMARVERRAGRYDQAAEHLEKCQKLRGVDPQNALEWAMLRAQRGEIADVEGLLQQEVDRGSPETPQILEALGLGYIDTYRLDGAMYCLNRLLEVEPDNVQALLWRASLWQTAGNEAGAEADYRRAVAAQPEHVAARCRLGELLLRRNRAQEALQHYEYLRQLPGGDRTDVLLGLARSHRQLGDSDAARQVLDDVLARHPQDGDALRERGKLALDAGAPAEAEGWLRQAVGVHSYDAQANYLLSQSLQRQGKVDEAREYEAARERIEGDLKHLEQVFGRVTKAPTDPAPRVEAGLICLRNGQEREGERWLLSALQQDPQDPRAHAALADYYERTGKPDLAAEHRRQAPGPK
jgi:Tfp pilus assembly protein PilF